MEGRKIMASAKQLKAQKLFAMRVRRGDFKKAIAKSKKSKSSKPKKSNPHKFPEDDWFEEYKRLGGKKNRKAYDKNVDIFIYHTHDIFITGDRSMYDSREEALQAVQKEAKIDNRELTKLFDSISNITAYT